MNNLEELRKKFIRQKCGINWSFGVVRKGATTVIDTINVVPKSIYENCYGMNLVEFEDVITCPVALEKIYLMSEVKFEK